MDRMKALGKRVYLASDDRVVGFVSGYAMTFNDRQEPRTLLVVTLDYPRYLGQGLNATVTEIVVDESAVEETI